MKIGIQGGKASYHEQAALAMYPEASVKYFETFTDVFKALEDGIVDTIVVAIANNRVQFIPDVYEQLTQEKMPFKIVGETYLRVDHALLGLPEAQLSDIEEVHSQAPAIGQSSHFLENELPNAAVIEEHDTAGSAKIVAETGDMSHAAIASKAAGELYGLIPLKSKIQDDKENITRFFEVALAGTQNKGDANKTTMLLKTPQTAGSLLGALKPFEDQNINLSYLQSRIIPNSAFEIDFFVEFEAGLDEERTQKVLAQLHRDGYETTVLGTYQAAKVPLNR